MRSFRASQVWKTLDIRQGSMCDERRRGSQRARKYSTMPTRRSRSNLFEDWYLHSYPIDEVGWLLSTEQELVVLNAMYLTYGLIAISPSISRLRSIVCGQKSSCKRSFFVMLKNAEFKSDVRKRIPRQQKHTAQRSDDNFCYQI
jgi:hypothetical protein